MEKPNEVAAEPKHSPSFWGFILRPAVVVILYVLSFGPAERFRLKSASTFPRMGILIDVFYSPIMWAYFRVPPFQEAFDVYMRWWVWEWARPGLIDSIHTTFALSPASYVRF
jgi:hypothetical protein